MTTLDDEAARVTEIWSRLGLPGIVDVHTHFMPKAVLDKVWRYFDSAGPLVGRHWPIGYHDAMTALARLPGVDDDWLRNVFYRNAAE